MTVYTLKELEKLLPAVAGIHAMAVKENIQALTDEYLVRVEKIGSGNWYWSFRSDTRKSKENQLNNLKAEEAKLVKSIADLEKQVAEEELKREDEGEVMERMSRKALLERSEVLLREQEDLDKGLGCYCDNDPEDLLRKVDETKKLKASALVLTDNIEMLEDHIGKMTTDRAAIAQVMAEHCGDEYVLGEGLKELMA